MEPIFARLRAYARTDDTILLLGASGAGKSRLARWCHARSPRGAQPFQCVDLSIIPDSMQLAELFGWKKGAFTGATTDHEGDVARAADGTLFFDEIDKLSLRAQAGLLQLIESRSYRVLGGGRSNVRSANVRFIAASNADLSALVRDGLFREDLYYRINVLSVRIPPLSERCDEIGGWAQYMLEQRHRRQGASGTVILSTAAREALQHADWPGNLRMLENVLCRAYVVATVEAGTAADVVVDIDHFAGELARAERSCNSTQLGRLLKDAAAFIVDEAQSGRPFDLGLIAGFRGLVLLEAYRRTGSAEHAFRLFGKTRLVESRNHQRALRREIEAADAFCSSLGFKPDLV